ncbi:hypothetical protein BKA69DRAFT_1078164 [Paraphysoderma sedebokerense]|nr:hypothetical protein BKA69DRAFT_1078164 [Paraphysoderma sedebokerense]
MSEKIYPEANTTTAIAVTGQTPQTDKMNGNTKPRNQTCCCCIDITVGMYIILVLKTVALIASIVITALEVAARAGTEIPNTLFAAILIISAINFVFLACGWFGTIKKRVQFFTAFYVYEILMIFAVLGVLGYYVYFLSMVASVLSNVGVGALAAAFFITPVVVLGVIALLWGYFLRVIYLFRCMLIEGGAGSSAA